VKKSVRLLIIFSAVAGLIVIFLLITSRENNREEGTGAEPEEIVRITDLEEGVVVKIELEQREDSLTLEHDESGWTLVPEPPFPIKTASLVAIDRNLRTLIADRVVEESPEDLAQYGLAPPQVTVTGSTADSTEVIINIGDQTPSRQAYYVQKEGDPRVFTVRNYKAQTFFTSLRSLRPDRLTHIDTEQLTYLYLNNGQEVEIIPLDINRFPLVAPFSSFMMMKPWNHPRATDAEKMQALIDGIPFAFMIQNYESDDAEDLSLFGLDQPQGEVILRDQDNSLHFFVGNSDNAGNRYAVEHGSRTVLALAEEDLSFLNSRPFNLMDKFVLIINIDFVESFTLSTGGERYTAEIIREADTETYFFDGTIVEEKPFKKYYQEAIGLVFEAEHPNPGPPAEGKIPAVVIDYELNIPQAEASVSFYDYNRDFYAADINGILEFLISKQQVIMTVQAAQELKRGVD
jgi:hypothetical protein